MIDGTDDAGRRAEFERICATLDAAGLPSADFGLFVNRSYPGVLRPAIFDDRGAVPVLLALLPTLSHPDALACVVGHLTTPFARPAAAAPLIALFRNPTWSSHSGLKWAIGNALSMVATPAHRDELLEITLDPKHGCARQMVVERLARISGDSRIVEALLSLATDPDVALHAQAGLRRRLGAATAADIIRPLLTHTSESVRLGAVYNMRKVAKALKPSPR